MSGIGLSIGIPLNVGLANSLPAVNITAAPVIAGTTDTSGNVTVSSLGTSDTGGASAAREWVRGTSTITATVVGSYPTAYAKSGADAGLNIYLREIWSATGFSNTTSYSNAISVAAAASGSFSSAYSSAYEIT